MSPQASEQDAKQTARKRRIETHPDKLKRVGMSKEEEEVIDEQSKLVGYAADIVVDPDKRRKYDMGRHGNNGLQMDIGMACKVSLLSSQEPLLAVSNDWVWCWAAVKGKHGCSFSSKGNQCFL